MLMEGAVACSHTRFHCARNEVCFWNQRGPSFVGLGTGQIMEQDLITDGRYRYVQSATEGTPLILLHGLFGALSNFEHLFNHFAGKMRVIIPMLPLYDLPLATTSAKTLCKHVEGFIDHLGLEKVHLLGNSLGGHVGLIYTKRNPDRVLSLSPHGQQWPL